MEGKIAHLKCVSFKLPKNGGKNSRFTCDHRLQIEHPRSLNLPIESFEILDSDLLLDLLLEFPPGVLKVQVNLGVSSREASRKRLLIIRPNSEHLRILKTL